jgi:predicted Ser/Thr protein kinase
MSDLANEDDARDERLGAVLAEYWQRVEGGEAVDQQRFLAEHADLAEALKAYFETACAVEQCRPLPCDTPRPQDSQPAAPPPAVTRDAGKIDGDSAGTGPVTGRLPQHFGRYQIQRKLGKGGMGHVYLAHDTVLNIPVALKVPELGDEDEPALVERFYREARAAAQVNHPNLCRVYDVNQIDGIHYLTMQFVDGNPLSELIRERPQLPERQVAELVRRLALALEQAHAKGVVHRDLKPSNIMITGPDGQWEPVVVDFGLARHRGEHQMTRLGQVLGTLSYMPPEQIDSRLGEPGPRSDIYSLGVILYQLLTGRLPFQGQETTLLHHICYEDPEPPSKYRPDLAPVLEAICRKAMARRPVDRYASMADLAAALTAYLDPTELSTRSVRILGAGPPPGDRKKVWLAAGLVAGVLLIAGWLAWQSWWAPGGDTAGKPRPPLFLYWHGFVQRERDQEWQDLHLRDGMVLYQGDQFRIAFSTSADCYVYVLNVEGDGSTTLWFPHAKIRLSHRCRSNEPYQIPDGSNWYELDRKAGSEQVYLLASHERLTDLERLLGEKPAPSDRAEKLAGLLRALERRAAAPLDSRGAAIRPDKRIARVKHQESGQELKRVMEYQLGTDLVVKRLRFEHRAAPHGK